MSEPVREPHCLETERASATVFRLHGRVYSSVHGSDIAVRVSNGMTDTNEASRVAVVLADHDDSDRRSADLRDCWMIVAVRISLYISTAQCSPRLALKISGSMESFMSVSEKVELVL